MPASLKNLRIHLTLLFLGVALIFVLLVGAGLYLGLRSYFAATTDEALQHKMVHEYQLLGVALPPELAAADRDWSTPRAGMFNRGDRGEHREEEEHEQAEVARARRAAEVAYNGELAAIFVLPLSQSGQLLIASAPPAPIAPDGAAVAAARQHGIDWRTVEAPDGSQVRLLTYSLPAGSVPAILQLGRALDDQQRVLGQLLSWFTILGGLSVVLLGATSWWLAGRSLRPAQEAWERQQVFVANAGHELRTPLTLLRASVEVVQRGLPAADALRRELLGDALHEVDHMARLVEDLLLLSRLDANQLQLKREPLAVAPLLQAVVRQIQPLADAAGLRISYECGDGVVVFADSTRVHQVLLILLDNAMRHTPRGGSITLRASVQAERRLPGVIIEVVDTGVGITLEQQQHVFERFWRADSTSPHKQSGAGLGLAIARQLVEVQQGWIDLESRPGQGSRFFFSLPTG